MLSCPSSPTRMNAERSSEQLRLRAFFPSTLQESYFIQISHAEIGVGVVLTSAWSPGRTRTPGNDSFSCEISFDLTSFVAIQSAVLHVEELLKTLSHETEKNRFLGILFSLSL